MPCAPGPDQQGLLRHPIRYSGRRPHLRIRQTTCGKGRVEQRQIHQGRRHLSISRAAPGATEHARVSQCAHDLMPTPSLAPIELRHQPQPHRRRRCDSACLRTDLGLPALQRHALAVLRLRAGPGNGTAPPRFRPPVGHRHGRLQRRQRRRPDRLPRRTSSRPVRHRPHYRDTSARSATLSRARPSRSPPPTP